MEKEAEAVGLTLHWADCGPDLTMFDGRQLREVCQLMKRYGEIRVRYVAHLVASLDIPDVKQSANNLRAIKLGLRDNWRSSGTTWLVTDIRRSRPDYDFPIPWLDRYGVPFELRRLIEEESTQQFFSTQRSAFKRWQRIGQNSDRLRPFLDAVGLLLPDFQANNVIAWLDRLCGDPQDCVEGIERNWDHALTHRPERAIYHRALDQIRWASIHR